MGSRRASRLFPVALLAAASVLLLEGPSASACSCVIPNPVDAVAAADLVFTGTPRSNAGDSSKPSWEVLVDGVVKGDVAEIETVSGDDWLSGCGHDLSPWAGTSIVIYADGSSGSSRLRPCTPTPTRADFQSQLDVQFGEPHATGAPAAVVAGRLGVANLHILNADGDVLARADLDMDVAAAAHCAGTRDLVVQDLSAKHVAIVDLMTMTATPVDDESGFGKFATFGADPFMCIDGQRLLSASGSGDNEGRVAVRTLDLRTGEGVNRSIDGVGRILPHPDGTAVVLPLQVGADIELLGAADLAPLSNATVDLGRGVSTVNGAFAPDGSQLAVLATIDGSIVEYDTGATHVITVDIVEGRPVDGSAQRIALPAGSVGRARSIGYVDDSTWVVERETDSAKAFDFVRVDGSLVATRQLDWGWGLTSVADGVLRSVGDGLEFVSRTGERRNTAFVPSASDVTFRSLRVAPIVAAPALEFDSSPISPLAIAPISGFDDDEPGDRRTTVAAVDTPESENSIASPEAAVDEQPDPAENDEVFAVERDSSSLPAGALISIAALVAVFLLGLNAIRKQRRNGPRRRFPPIG